MIQVDYAQANFFFASLSGVVYPGNSNANVQTQGDVNWHR